MHLLPKQHIHILKQTLRSTSVVDFNYLKEKNITQCYPVCWRCTSHAAFQFECQALIWKLDPYTSLSVAARATSTLLSSMCRKEFSVMGMSPWPFFFKNKKASGNRKRAGQTAWTVRLCSYFYNNYSLSLTLPRWNQPATVTFSHLFPLPTSTPDTRF